LFFTLLLIIIAIKQLGHLFKQIGKKRHVEEGKGKKSKRIEKVGNLYACVTPKKDKPDCHIGRVGHSTGDKVKARRVRAWFIYNWIDV
jgi:hypothetical protein